MAILEKEVLVKLNSKNIEYYKKLGYGMKNTKPQQKKQFIKVKDLMDESNVKVNIICDNCGKMRVCLYSKYKKMKSVRDNGIYLCQGCIHTSKRKSELEIAEIVEGIGKGYKLIQIIKYNNSVDSLFLVQCPKGHRYTKNLTNLGKKNTCGKCYDRSERMTGENNPNWNPNLKESERYIDRWNPQLIVWRKEVFIRDNFIFQCCGFDRGGKLQGQHKD